MDAFTDNINFQSWLLAAPDVDTKVWVEVIAEILAWGSTIDVTINTVKVFENIASSEFKIPTQDQLDLWDLENRCIEYYELAKTPCDGCNHIFKFHVTGVTLAKCLVKGCDCTQSWEDCKL